MGQLREVSKLEADPFPNRCYHYCVSGASDHSSIGRYADAW